MRTRTLTPRNPTLANGWLRAGPGRSATSPEVRTDLLLQHRDQLRLHEAIVVRDSETDHTSCLELGPKVRKQLALMLLLHAKDELRPFDKFRRKRGIRAAVGTSGGALDTWPIGENRLCRWTSQAVLAAEK